MKSYAARKIDFVFLTLALGLILFIVYRHFLKNPLLSAAAAALTLTFFYLVYFKIKRKNKISAEDFALCDKIFFNIKYLPQNKINLFITELFNKAGYRVALSDGIITAEKQGKNYIVAAVFNKSAGCDDIYKCEYYKKLLGCDGFYLLCQAADKSAYLAMRGAENCHILDRQSLFAAIKKYGAFPECIMESKRPKSGFKEFLSKAFERDKFKGYFFIGVIMFAFSFISPFKTYYLVASVVLFAFSALSLTGKKTKSPRGDIL